MASATGSRRLPLDARAVWQTVRTELRAVPTPLWAWLSFLGLLLLIGAVAAVRSLFPGDKAVGTSPSYEWGLLIVGYVFFAITTSGLCLASSLGTVFGIPRFLPLERRHAVLAVLCLTTAFGIIALDLQYPVRMVFGAMFNPSPASPMWWMGVFYGIYFGCLLVETWSMFFGYRQIHSFACMFSSVMAVIAPATLGAVFGVLAARAIWNGPFTVLLMVASAFLSGTSLLGLAFGIVHRLHLRGHEQAAAVALPAIRLLLAMGLLLVSVLVAREVLAGYWASDPDLARATRSLVVGPLAWQFWGLRVVGGLVLPFALIAIPRARTPGLTTLAAALSITGVFADRLTFVAAGQIAPSTIVAGVSSAPYVTYSPTPVEIGVLLGGAAFVMTAYTLAERYLDLGVTDIHPLLAPASLRSYRDAVVAWRVRAVAVQPKPEEAEIAAALDRGSPPVVTPEPVAEVPPDSTAGAVVPQPAPSMEAGAAASTDVPADTLDDSASCDTPADQAGAGDAADLTSRGASAPADAAERTVDAVEDSTGRDAAAGSEKPVADVEDPAGRNAAAGSGAAVVPTVDEPTAGEGTR